MHRHPDGRATREGSEVPPAPGPRATGAQVIARAAGNRATQAMLMRDAAPAAPAAPSTGGARQRGRTQVLVNIELTRGDASTGQEPERLQGDGPDGAIEALTFSQGVSMRRDRETGQAAGRRTHRDIVFTKAFDSASPLLFRALTENQAIPRVVISFMRGGEAYQTIELRDVRVSNVEQSVTEDMDVETVALSFRSIAITHTRGGITHEDSVDAAR